MGKRQLWQAKFKGCRESLAGHPLTDVDSVFFWCPYDWHCCPQMVSGLLLLPSSLQLLTTVCPQTVWDFFN